MINKLMKVRRSVWILLLTIVVGPTANLYSLVHAASAQPRAFIVFSTNPEIKGEEIAPGDVRQQFNCAEQIYAITGFEGIEPGIYTFTTRWIAPNEQVVKQDRSQLEMILKGQVAYLANSLQIKTEDPSGDEESPFSGEWRVEVLYKENLIGAASFNLDC